MSGGSGHTAVRGVRIEWQHQRDGHVCYEAKFSRATNGTLASCIKRLHPNEITYRITRLRKTRQLVIVGVKGPLVAKVYLRFPAKRWTAPANRNVFFGYVPRGKVLSVVKVLKDGTRREFDVDEYSA